MLLFLNSLCLAHRHTEIETHRDKESGDRDMEGLARREGGRKEKMEEIKERKIIKENKECRQNLNDG